MSKTIELAHHLETLHINDMYKTDFYWTWDKTDDEIDAVFTVADAAGPARAQQEHPDLRFRPGHLHLPRQLHPYPLLLRLRLQPAGPGGSGPGREEVPDRPRRDRS